MASEPPPLDDVNLEPQLEQAYAQEEEVSPFTDPESPQEEELPPIPKEEEEEEEEEEVHSKPEEDGLQPSPSPPLQPVPLLEQEDAPTLEPRAADDTEEPVVKQKPASAAPPEREPAKPSAGARSLDLFDEDEVAPRAEEEHRHHESLDEEERDMFEMAISVAEPERSGDGMGAYVTYAVSTKTTMPTFHNPENMVRRRFSDFLGLHQRLEERYAPQGRVVPPTPDKDFVGTTKMKFSKSEESGVLFLERRRAALERYLMRLSRHPVLRKDDDLRNFLENPADLPKAKETGAMSGAGLLRLMRNVGGSIAKIAGKKSESDTWFEEQQRNYEVLDTHLKKLHVALETMVSCRKDLCTTTGSFVKSIATVGNVEENNSVAHALSRLSEVQDKVEVLHQEQSSKDLFIFAETVKDYIALLVAIRTAFAQRVKAYSSWQSAIVSLAKKREAETKLQVGGKPEKLAQVQQEVKEWEVKVEEGQKSFSECSKTVKAEVKRFEAERAVEFRAKFIGYLDAHMSMQQELIRLWEGYLPEAQSIAE